MYSRLEHNIKTCSISDSANIPNGLFIDMAFILNPIIS